jgi:hypothetical protein
VNQWDSLMIYEETTQTLFPNDLFSMPGTEIATDRDVSQETLGAARDLGYQADDRASLERALDRIEEVDLKTVAPMHGPALKGHFAQLLRAFRENSLSTSPRPEGSDALTIGRLAATAPKTLVCTHGRPGAATERSCCGRSASGSSLAK